MSDINTNKANTVQFVAVVVVIAALSRLLPHPYNFTPVAAMALFGGAYLRNRSTAWGTTLAAMLLSDVLLHAGYLLGWRAYPGFHTLMPLVYLSIAGITLLGSRLYGRVSAGGVLANTLLGSLIFFIITNFGVFLLAKDLTWARFLQTYIDAIPFFGNTALGDLLYSALLFGSYEWIKQRQTAIGL